MWDEMGWADADQFHERDWELNTDSASLSLERVDEVFDDLEALLDEALA